jgi:hypothetical protein
VYSLYITSRTEDVSRFYGMSWRSSYLQALTPVNTYYSMSPGRDYYGSSCSRVTTTIPLSSSHRSDAAFWSRRTYNGRPSP